MSGAPDSNQTSHAQSTYSTQTALHDVSNTQPQTQTLMQQQQSQHTKNQDQCQNWQKVKNKKRIRNSPENTNVRKRQTSINDYWLNSPVETSNIYERLNNDESTDSGKINDNNTGKTVIKAPPIFIEGVENIIPLKFLLDEIAENQYTIKILRNNQVKIQPLATEKYISIMDALKKKGTQGFTYQSKTDRKFKVVLRNMHPTIDLAELKEEIEAKNHKVISITNILHAGTKKPLPLFFVEMKQKKNNKDIYSINKLLNIIVSFEQAYKKREIPQCTQCQTYGHTKNYCFKGPRCVKCAGKHMTNDCPRREKFAEVKCYKCERNYPASYKGCEVYKQLQQKLYPRLRPKQKMGQTDKSIHQKQQTNITAARQIQPYTSNNTYAQISKKNIESFEQQVCDNNNNVEQPAALTTEQQGTNKIEELILQLISKMDTMLNLLAAMITKMN
ncbi:nucleic-acid-binding protein from transposon x-element [Lasius niger]|uniref:Nucleic-acid-binding protein from transposon x-element n=1 Tax=Lasius niger TaxID=67767 RepID=A0A0J7KTN8_LASNI|nr:nucleic-acid-binding protein from transposon x-element [Lasius niger]